jgi:hypothetical protein
MYGMPSRVKGALRSARAVHARAGVGGALELLAARALPRLACVQRTLVFQLLPGYDDGGAPPRRVLEPEPALLRACAAQAARGEPEVVALDEARIRRRLDRGDELWVLEDGGVPVNLSWVTHALHLAGAGLALAGDERALEGIVTLGRREQGYARRAQRHILVTNAARGNRVLTAINGLNRGYAEAQRRRNSPRLATAYSVTLVGRTAVRVSAGDDDDSSAWLAAHGFTPGRWHALPPPGPDGVRRWSGAQASVSS